MPADQVERIGVARSRAAVEQASLLLVLVDGSCPLGAEDREILALARDSGKPWILVLTKKDLAREAAPVPAEEKADAVVSLSARTGEGLEALEQAVAARFPAGETPAGQVLTNARQAEAMGRAAAAIAGARSALDLGFTPDAILTDVESAMNALGELTGRTAREDMVSRIFQRFCVGK